MMMSAIVTYKDNGEGGGYTAVDLEDPYNVWLDPTGRNLYTAEQFGLSPRTIAEDFASYRARFLDANA